MFFMKYKIVAIIIILHSKELIVVEVLFITFLFQVFR